MGNDVKQHFLASHLPPVAVCESECDGLGQRRSVDGFNVSFKPRVCIRDSKSQSHKIWRDLGVRASVFVPFAE